MAIEQATTRDIPALEALLNSAYRGEHAKKGWTNESDLIQGERRTDADTLCKLIQTPGAVFLKYTNDQQEVEGCVFLQKMDRGLYLGMLSVSPLIQAKGIGKQLIAAAELHASKNNCPAVFMKVISIRHDLVAWYERKGYRKTGETEAFPTDNKFGVPTQALEFIILEKQSDGSI